MKQLKDFITPTQQELFAKLCLMFKGKAISLKSKYILVPGEAPIMLVAHLDTVHAERVKSICATQDGNIIMSPQGIGGDDRCGVYALVTAFNRSKHKPWLLFTCNEEIGGIGAKEFCNKYRKGALPKELSDLKCIIEIDRRGSDDAVYYDCTNVDFEAYITSKGFKTEFGSYSDISDIAPELGLAAVNLSSGYHNAHTQHEYIDCKQLNATVERVIEIIKDAAAPDFPRYEYVGDFYGEYDIYDEDKVLKNIPAEIREAYADLLCYYDASELETYRDLYGDRGILLLYESEFGFSNNPFPNRLENWSKHNR